MVNLTEEAKPKKSIRKTQSGHNKNNFSQLIMSISFMGLGRNLSTRDLYPSNLCSPTIFRGKKVTLWYEWPAICTVTSPYFLWKYNSKFTSVRHLKHIQCFVFEGQGITAKTIHFLTNVTFTPPWGTYAIQPPMCTLSFTCKNYLLKPFWLVPWIDKMSIWR